MLRVIPNYVNEKLIKIFPRVINQDRYYLRFRMKNSTINKRLIVIMKNPSKSLINFNLSSYNATTKYLDYTTYNVLEFANNNGYTDIILLNLFSFYDPKPFNLNVRYGFISGSNTTKNPVTINKITYDRNMRNIKLISKITNNQDIIFAWGGSNRVYKGYYKERYKQIENIFTGNNNNLYEVTINNTLSKKIMPLHPLRWKSNYILQNYTPR